MQRCIISAGHGTQLLRLTTSDQQEKLGKLAADEGWSVKETEKRVKQLNSELGTGNSKVKKNVALGPESLKDPWADLWTRLHAQQDLTTDVVWEAKYRIHQAAEGIQLMGWDFFAGSTQKLSQAALGAWFRQMGQFLEEGKVDPVLSEGDQETLAVLGQMRKATESLHQNPIEVESNGRINLRAAELWMPKTAEEAKEMKASSSKIRLPQTQQDWREVEAAAQQGPPSLYERLCGKDSYWAKKAAHLTWQDLGESDPLTACHKIVALMREGLDLIKDGTGARVEALSAHAVDHSTPDPIPLTPEEEALLAELRAHGGLR